MVNQILDCSVKQGVDALARLKDEPLLEQLANQMVLRKRTTGFLGSIIESVRVPSPNRRTTLSNSPSIIPLDAGLSVGSWFSKFDFDAGIPAINL